MEKSSGKGAHTVSKMSFTGSYEHSLDGKGRVIVPAPLREALGESFTVGLNPDVRALALYPREEWEAVTQKLEHVDLFNRRANQCKRQILGNAFTDCSMDGQGRVLLPPPLRQLGHLTKDIVFVGMDKYVEIWDAERYRLEQQDTFDNYDVLIEYMQSNGRDSHPGL